MLINLVGWSAVEAALIEAGMVNPSLNRPFHTTRETFILTLEQWPALANRYRAANEAGRRALLANTVDRIPLPDVAAMRALSTRGEVGSLGWFASATTSAVPTPPWPPRPQTGPVLDQRGAFAQRRRPRVRSASVANDWRKGGVGAGVLTLAYLARTWTGQSYVVSVFARTGPGPSILPDRVAGNES
jgi:hypothetical protein